jgi:hypothetical protein
MTEELLEATGREAPVAIEEMAVASHEGGHERGHSGVAILLAIAAVVAAIIGTRASMISSDASDTRQSALRTEVQRSAGAMTDIQALYLEELPVATRVLQARIAAAQFQAAAAGQNPVVAHALAIEASVESQLADLLSSNSQLANDQAYALPAGGFDLSKRLADLRAETPGLVSLDPDGIASTADRLAQKALLLTLALLPAGLCALLGVMAQPLRRYRRLLLASGSVALAAGVVMAFGVEVLA